MDERTLRALIGIGAGAGAMVGVACAARRGRYDFAGKVVVITGGSRGLGLVMARRFAAEGAKLALLARGTAELHRAADELHAGGADVFAVTCDVTRQSLVEDAIGQVVRHFGGIDVVVNNAGVIQVAPFEHMTLDDFRTAMAVHFYGPLYVTLAALPHLRRRRESRLVNISSIGGKVAPPHLLPYVASKHALLGLSDGLRHELRKDGVYVTTVAPGLMRTGSPRNVGVKGRHEAEYAWFKLGDSLPGLSISAEGAARRIVEACRRGAAELTITWNAKLAAAMDVLTPGLMATLMSMTNRLLPGPDPGRGDVERRGFEVESAATRSPLAMLTDRAARRNNEL